MRIRFTGPGVTRRIVAGVEWSREAGRVQEVEAGLAAELLTSPEGRFVVADDEPLLRLTRMGQEEVVGLAVAGVGSVEELAGLDEEGVERVAEALGVGKGQVGRWVKQAQRMKNEE